MRTGRLGIRVLTVDDHPVVRAGVRALIEKEDDLQVVAEGRDGAEAVALYKEHQPDVVVMDIRMPNVDGVHAIRTIVASHREARILALTSYEGDADVYRAIRAGARGYLLKDTLETSLVDAIRRVAAGERIIPPEIATRLAEFLSHDELTPRELEVLTLIARGLSNAEIATALFVSETTVKTHVAHVLMKLDLRDRVQAVVLAYESGLVQPGES